MDTPIDHPYVEPHRQAKCQGAEPGKTWLAVLLRMFADMACRLR